MHFWCRCSRVILTQSGLRSPLIERWRQGPNVSFAPNRQCLLLVLYSLPEEPGGHLPVCIDLPCASSAHLTLPSRVAPVNIVNTTQQPHLPRLDLTLGPLFRRDTTLSASYCGLQPDHTGCISAHEIPPFPLHSPTTLHPSPLPHLAVKGPADRRLRTRSTTSPLTSPLRTASSRARVPSSQLNRAGWMSSS